MSYSEDDTISRTQFDLMCKEACCIMSDDFFNRNFEQNDKSSIEKISNEIKLFITELMGKLVTVYKNQLEDNEVVSVNFRTIFCF